MIEMSTRRRSAVWGAVCVVGAIAAVCVVAVYGVETIAWDAAHETWTYVERPLSRVVTVVGVGLAAILAVVGVRFIVRVFGRAPVSHPR